MKSFAFMLFCALVTVAVISQVPDNKLHIYMCDVGQGDGILISFKQTQVLIDGGPDNSIQTCLGAHMPFWDRTIEAVYLSNNDTDHFYGFIDVFKRYKVDRFFVTPIDNPAKTYTQLKEVLTQKNIPLISAHAGSELKIGAISLKVIFPTSEFIENHSDQTPEKSFLSSRTSVRGRNDFSLMMLLTYHQFSTLFTGDASPYLEEAMQRTISIPQVYFLKVPHHGSKNGLIQTLLDATNPQVAAISVALKNRYELPSPSVIEMLTHKGLQILRTDKDGESEVVTDGKNVWVKR